jgi:GR25 family glycosyltransferase involved in LPS biosynthesis
MNTLSFSGSFERLRHKLMLHMRLLDTNTKANSFAATNINDTIQRVYVINLDRKPDRWRQVKQELGRIRDRSGAPLSSITRRLSAIDARHLEGETNDKVLLPYYSLADHLLVEPSPRVRVDAKSRARRINMTRQEIAVALSHIEAWKLIAASDVPYTLVLEDDVYFRRGFAQNIDSVWRAIMRPCPKGAAFDLLYLSFQEVGIRSDTKKRPARLARKPYGGIWWASGYVLSKAGAQKLLELLPSYGPIDLWLNLQFGKLDVLITRSPIIEQRIDVPSTNSYSVMPVLSQIGVHTREKPLVAHVQKLPGPVFACGEPGSGLTSLAMALSMLGYTCCSDIAELPVQEQESLLTKRRYRSFNAYVNIGSLKYRSLTNIAKIYPHARFIFTSLAHPQPSYGIRDRMLYLPYEHQDKWAALSTFLEREYPAFPYPVCNDIDQRGITKSDNKDRKTLPFKRLKFDSSPWIVSSKGRKGIFVTKAVQNNDSKTEVISAWSDDNGIDDTHWRFRDDTFPSNLTLFTPNNAGINRSGIMNLTLRNKPLLSAPSLPLQLSPGRSFSMELSLSKFDRQMSLD